MSPCHKPKETSDAAAAASIRVDVLRADPHTISSMRKGPSRPKLARIRSAHWSMLVARAASHFNIFALSLTVKSLVFSVLLVVYCAFLIRYMGSDLATLLDAQVRLKTLSAP